MVRVYNKSSKEVIDGHPKSPTANQLEFGEIAINYAKGHETLFFKNDENEVIPYKMGGGEIIGDYIDDVKYNKTEKKIVFYKGEEVICDIDASDFVKDGMVENVTYENKKLTITFNQDAGKNKIELNIGDVFDSDNYYTKSEVDKKIADIAAGGEIDLDGYATKEWVKDNYPQVKYFETIDEYESGVYTDKDIVLVDEANIIRYNGNDFRTVRFRVIDGDSDVMKIAVYYKSNGKFEFIDDYDELDSETMTPIGIVVVPESHNRYGDGSAGIMSLVGMSWKTPDTGMLGDVEDNDTTKASAICWGASTGHGLTGRNKFPMLGSSDGPVYSALQGTCDKNAMLPSDRWTNGKQCLTDKSTYYFNYDTADRYYAPSPYNNERANSLYVVDTGGNPFADFSGKTNTETILKNATAQIGWKTDSEIKNISGTTGYFPMACCCWRFHTEGTEQGDWYLPGMGEVGYVSPKYEKINVAIRKVNEVFGKVADELLPGEKKPQNLMSSTLLSNGNVARLSIMNNNAGSTSSGAAEYARAFLKIKL